MYSPRRSNKALILVVVIILFFIIGGVIIYFLFDSKDSKDSEDSVKEMGIIELLQPSNSWKVQDTYYNTREFSFNDGYIKTWNSKYPKNKNKYPISFEKINNKKIRFFYHKGDSNRYKPSTLEKISNTEIKQITYAGKTIMLKLV